MVPSLSQGNDSVFEIMFCTYVNQYYAFVKSNADAILNLVPFALAKLQTALGGVERIINQVVRESIEQVADLVASLTDIFCGLSGSDAIRELCELLHKCKALVALISGDAPLSPYSSISIGGVGIGDAYETFQETVCFLNPLNLSNMIQDQLLEMVRGLMDGLKEAMNTAIEGLEKAKELYWEALINAKLFGYNIFDILEMMEMFFECAMGLCDYTGASVQDTQDIRNKAKIGWLDGVYFLDLGEPEAKVREAITEYTSKINVLEGIVGENDFRHKIGSLSTDIKNDPSSYPTIGTVTDSINSIVIDTKVDSDTEVVGKVWQAVANNTAIYEQRPCADDLSSAIKCSSLLELF